MLDIITVVKQGYTMSCQIVVKGGYRICWPLNIVMVLSKGIGVGAEQTSALLRQWKTPQAPVSMQVISNINHSRPSSKTLKVKFGMHASVASEVILYTRIIFEAIIRYMSDIILASLSQSLHKLLWAQGLSLKRADNCPVTFKSR